MRNAIEVKNLKVVFPDRGRMIRAVEGVDLTVKKGNVLRWWEKAAAVKA